MSLQTKLFLTTTAAIVTLVGAPEWLTYQHTTSLFNRPETVMQHSESPQAIGTLQAEKNSLLVHLAVVHVFNGALTVIALTFVLNWLWYRLVLSPIRLLLARINRTGRGTWTEIPVLRGDEIGELTGAYNDLGKKSIVTVHQFATTSMLSATAVTAQRIARKAELGQNQIRGVSDLLRQQRQTYVIPDSVFADLEVVIQYLKDIQRHSDDEFYSQFTQRRGRFSGEPGPTPGASARERAVGAATG